MSEKISSVKRWTWARPDVQTCALLVQGLTTSLRVSDAIRIITYVSGARITFGEEVASNFMISMFFLYNNFHGFLLQAIVLYPHTSYYLVSFENHPFPIMHISHFQILSFWGTL